MPDNTHKTRRADGNWKTGTSDAPRFSIGNSRPAHGCRQEIIFTRGFAMRAIGGDTDTLSALFGVTSLNDLPRYAVSLLAAVAFGRISPEEMLTVTQTVATP